MPGDPEIRDPEAGLATDSRGGSAVDPTKNVLDLVGAAIRRQDDLREADSRHAREIGDLRAKHADDLRKAESARIDAIRAVDVGAVNRAAEVSAQQANTLAAQVIQSAETLRTQVAAADVAARANLAAALEPIQKDIAELRKVQYATEGGRTSAVEAREDRGEKRLDMGQVLVFLGLLLAAVSFYFSNKG